MGAPLPNADFMDGFTALRTGFPFFLINIKMVVKRPCSIHPIDAGAKLLNALAQSALDSGVEDIRFRSGKSIG